MFVRLLRYSLSTLVMSVNSSIPATQNPSRPCFCPLSFFGQKGIFRERLRTIKKNDLLVVYMICVLVKADPYSPKDMAKSPSQRPNIRSSPFSINFL